MNLDSLSSALYHISYSVANLTKKNFKASVQEITRLVAQHGLEAEKHLLRCLFSHVDFSGDGKSSGKDFHQTQYLIQECLSLINKPTFISLICNAIENPLPFQKSLKPSSQLLPQLGKVLKLNKVQEVVFGIALLSSNSEIKQLAHQFVRQKLPDLLRSYIDSDCSSLEGGLQDISPEIVHFILTHLLYLSKDKLGIGTEQKEAFIKTLKKDFPPDQVPLILSPILYSKNSIDITMDPQMTCEPSSMSKLAVESAAAEMLRDIGYEFTSSIEECKQNIQHMRLTSLSPSLIAKFISAMVTTHLANATDSLPLQSLGPGGTLWNDVKEKHDKKLGATSWDIDVFVKTIRELNPNLDWKEVVGELDHSEFKVKDKTGLQILWKTLCLGLTTENFPISYIYRHWHNVDGQFSLIHQILLNEDVAYLMEYPCRQVVLDVLKSPIEDDQKSIANWKNLDLIETLLYISETAALTKAVHELFKFPSQQCPDLLILGLLQLTNLSTSPLRHELLQSLLLSFLGNHPNSAIILHAAWHNQVHTNQVRPIVLQCMGEWYRRGDGDQARLTRVLDVAHDLKALPRLLNINHFPFVIDLACLASRREYLKLDKWLTDKIREHGEPFVHAIISFLKRRFPQIIGGKEEPSLKGTQLTTETVTTIVSNLQKLASTLTTLSPEVMEAIHTMSNNSTIIMSKSLQPTTPTGVIVTKPATFANPTPTLGNVPLETINTLGASVASLNINPSGSTNPMFPMSSFSSVNSGSPSKLLNTTSGSSNPFTSLMPNVSSQFNPIQPSNNSTSADNSFLENISQIFPDMPQVISKEVEEEANSYFQRIYNRPPHPTLSIDEVLEMLKRYRESSVQRERDVFSCMVRNLFEEYRFFPQYPETELMITAQLFGGIIEHQLITYVPLGIALRYVLDAIRKPFSSKMYYFGITALEKFKHRLKDYPQYCNHLGAIQHFSEFPPSLREHIEYGANHQEPPMKVQPTSLTSQALGCLASGYTQGLPTRSLMPPANPAVVAPPTASLPKTPVQTIGKPSIANATNIDTLLVATEKDEQVIIPPEAVLDKVAFIVNNLSQMNLAQKTEEFKEIIKDEYYPWAAQYLVMKRASIEANFHNLYSNFIDTLKSQELVQLIQKETFRNIKVLLRTEKGGSNFSDRSLLKNLGHWLGVITLAKNKPVLQLKIDIKALLIEAYHKGHSELLYVVPFVAKVLESTAKSKVFRPPNPWTMGIMKLLGELHKESDLKLNLKFEIEVLCKNLNIDVNDFKDLNTLKNPDMLSKIELQLSPMPNKNLPSLLPIAPPKPSHAAAPVVAPPAPPLIGVSIANVINNPEENLINAVPMMGIGTPPFGSTTPVSNQVAQPQYSFHEINTVTASSMNQVITVGHTIPLFQMHPTLKQFVKPSVEKAIQEWIQPIIERSIKIAVATSEQLIKKDFALESDDQKMRIASHHLVRSLTAGMALITCRDTLITAISSAFKNNVAASLRSYSQLNKDSLESAASAIAQDNIELACGFIQKTAVERAIAEFEKRMNQDYEVRKVARSEGRRYYDSQILSYQSERMPEPIRLKVSGVSPQQLSIYEDIGRNVPGFLPSNDYPFVNNKPAPIQSIPYPDDNPLVIFEKTMQELEQVYSHCFPPGSFQHQALTNLVDAIYMIRNSRDLVTGLNVLQKIMESLFEGIAQLSNDQELSMRFKDAHIIALKTLADPRIYGQQWMTKQVSRILLESREDFKFNIDLIDILLRVNLINMSNFDHQLAQHIENGSYSAISFAIQLCKMYLFDDKSLISESDLNATIEILIRLGSQNRPIHEGLPQFVELLRHIVGDYPFTDRSPGGPMAMLISGINQAKDTDDPSGLREKTEYILKEWICLFHTAHSPRESSKAFALIVNHMNMQGILKTDDLIGRFFRISLEICVENCYRSISETTNPSNLTKTKCFNMLDAYVKLITLLVKNSGDAVNSMTKINLLHKILGVIAGALMTDHDIKQMDFHQLPYHRILIMLFLELCAPDPILDSLSSQLSLAYCHTLHCLRPQKVPGFAYSWLELISHRSVLGRILSVNHQQKTWSIYSQLISALFKFLAPFLRNVELPKPIQLLYKGTLKVLLVLLHDFPEFLCDYHYTFCDIIPANCIQMRNLILSAFPRSMRLPDPFTPNLKVDLLAEISQGPRILSNFTNMIQPPSLRKDLDSYLKTRSPVTFLSELRSSVQISPEPGNKYNIALLNAIVLYVGTQAINMIQVKGQTPNMGNITHSSNMDIFQNLAVDLDTEGRYLFLNAIANQLRYPNSHTHYFSCTLLYLFAENNIEAIQEQITRVLLERLIVNRPHPWGLLVTFIELIKNPTFKFWNHEFVRCAPEIEKLFESVARSCMQTKPDTAAS